jgi:CubicO group peptidase (beta-lactamase class C family)
MKRLFFLLLAVSFLTSTTQAQWTPELDAYIEKARQDWDVPGLAVTVVQDGKVLVAKGYGVRTLGKPERIDENTLFDTASLSKSFTAAATAALVDEGKISWDDPVRKHLPTFLLADPYRTQNATIRDLLAHRLGLEQGNWVFVFPKYDTAEVIHRMSLLEERQPFRTGMIYSNLGYTAAGEAAAKAAGVSFSDLLRTRLIEPLGMRDSTVGVLHDLAPNHASGHSLIDGKQIPIPSHKAMNALPANAVNSTARDMARWLLFQLGDGTWEGKRIISAANMREMHEPQIIVPTTPEFRASRGLEHFATYGLGWQVWDFRGHPLLWHSGNATGMPVYMALLPHEKIGVCVMVNTWNAPILHGALAARIFDVLLGVEKPTDWAGDALAANRRSVQRAVDQEVAVEKARVRDTKPSRPLDAYAGDYEDQPHGTMAMQLKDGKLTLTFAGGEVADLEHWHYDTFRVRWRDRIYDYADTFATFALDAEGKPRSFVMQMNRDTIDAKRR